MFDRILLPLDGSELAETAIPYVRVLATQLKAEVFIIHACPLEHRAYHHMHQIYMDKMSDNFKQTLRENEQANEQLNIHTEIIPGDPTDVILDYVQKKAISMVAMTSHGTSGFREWAMGSVADKVVRGVRVPTLLIHTKLSRNTTENDKSFKKILLPLDMSDASKTAVPYTVQLAKKLDAKITLFSMVQTIFSKQIDSTGLGFTTTNLGVNWKLIDDTAKNNAEKYLEDIEGEIQKAGANVTHQSKIGNDAAYEILEMEKETQYDLIVMATRGRSNIARWALGSVTEKVLRGGDRPILVIRETTD